MYFVTTKRPEYVLFCMTPSERVGIGLTEKQIVHLMARSSSADDWHTLREWNANVYSHTDFMAQLHRVDEPADPQQFLEFLPAHLR
jgi:hypothetical protein